jgi:site-specific DNA-methyltransferase (adenine-specific)/adenine-specific DNA-methyltransferase
MEKPLSEQKKFTGFEVYNVNDYDFFRNELEAKRLIIEALGMQALPGNNLWDAELDGRMVAILGINRIATAAEFSRIVNNIDIGDWTRRQAETPNKPIEKITFVCMGHDPNLKALFIEEMQKLGFKIDLEIVDILRDKKDLTFKRDSDACIKISDNKLSITDFYPMNLLQKLSIQCEDVSDWKELVDSVMIDWNYDGATFCPSVTDIPAKKEMVKGIYEIPKDAGTIHVKITDLLSESWEGSFEA